MLLKHLLRNDVDLTSTCCNFERTGPSTCFSAVDSRFCASFAVASSFNTVYNRTRMLSAVLAFIPSQLKSNIIEAK